MILTRGESPEEGQSVVRKPYLLQYNDAHYVIPETSTAMHVRSHELNLETGDILETRILLERVRLSDPTIFEFGDTWWLFGHSAGSELHAWHASSPHGPWTPHLHNPIKVGSDSARPAGTPFRHDGTVIRPSQDGSQTYGWRLRLNRIECLSPTEFSEVTVRTMHAFQDGLRARQAIDTWVRYYNEERPHSTFAGDRTPMEEYSRLRRAA